MLRQFFEYARYLKPVVKLFIAALAAGALAAAASGFGFPVMIAKVFPVVFDNTQIPPEIHDIIARDGSSGTHARRRACRGVFPASADICHQGNRTFFNVLLDQHPSA